MGGSRLIQPVGADQDQVFVLETSSSSSSSVAVIINGSCSGMLPPSVVSSLAVIKNCFPSILFQYFI